MTKNLLYGTELERSSSVDRDEAGEGANYG